MRILHIIPSLEQADGGPSHAVGVMERALRERGVDVEIATTEGATDGHHRPEAPAGVVHRYFRRNTGFYKISLPLGWWLWRNVRNYDVVHIHALFSFSSLAGAFAARWRGVPYVLRPLGTLATYGMTRRRPWLKRLSFRLFEARMLRHAAAVHFTSSQELREAQALGVKMHGVVIPLALDPAMPGDTEPLLARYPMLRGKSLVLFLSRLDPKKNIEGLLRAIAACSEEVPEARWLIAGDGDAEYSAFLRRLATTLGIDGLVTWAGRLDGAEKASAFALADLFVLPSWSENFGIAAAEALQAGLPVVLGSGVAIAELAQAAGAGTIVEGNPEDIGPAMMTFLRDPELRLRASRNARQLALDEFSPDMLGQRLEQLYAGLAKAAVDA